MCDELWTKSFSVITLENSTVNSSYNCEKVWFCQLHKFLSHFFKLLVVSALVYSAIIFHSWCAVSCVVHVCLAKLEAFVGFSSELRLSFRQVAGHIWKRSYLCYFGILGSARKPETTLYFHLSPRYEVKNLCGCTRAFLKLLGAWPRSQ